jgi:hypothetical protein
MYYDHKYIVVEGGEIMPEDKAILSIIVEGSKVNDLASDAGKNILTRITNALSGESLEAVNDSSLESDICEGIRVGDICIGRSRRN